MVSIVTDVATSTLTHDDPFNQQFWSLGVHRFIFVAITKKGWVIKTRSVDSYSRRYKRWWEPPIASLFCRARVTGDV